MQGRRGGRKLIRKRERNIEEEGNKIKKGGGVQEENNQEGV